MTRVHERGAGRTEEAVAEAQAREVVVDLADTDLLDLRGDASLALAVVLAAAGDHSHEASDALARAVQFYERKGCIAAVANARSQLPT